MAETYKGLTIRIGGDSSGLEKSLRSVSSSIAQTESQLRKMRQALNLDPGNVDALSKSMDLMGKKAIETQRRVQTLKRQIDQLGNEKVSLLGGKQSTETVSQLAELTEDASMRAAEARKNFAAITEELAKFYRPINESVTATSMLKGEVDDATDAVREFGKEWRSAHNGKSFSTSKLIDEEGIDSAIGQLKSLGLITDEQETKLRSLRDAYRDAFDENQVAQAVSQLDKMNSDLIKAGAEASNVSKRFSEMSKAAMMKGYGEGVEDQLKSIEKASNSVEAELRQLDDALKLDPNNVELMSSKMRDLTEASSIAQAKVDTLNQKLDRLRADGAEDLANDMTDVRMEVERTSKAYDEATAAVNKLEGQIREAKVAMEALDNGDEGISDGFEEARQSVIKLEGELRDLRETQEQTEASFRDAKMAQEFVETSNQVKLAKSQVGAFNDELSSMRKFSGVTAGSLTSLGMSLSTSVTPTLIAAGWGIVQSADDIDTAYRDMRKTVEGTESDFEDLRQAAIDFSTTNVTSADQMLSIQAIGGELGIAVDELKSFSETVSNIDVATDLNSEDAATALGQLANIMHMTGEQFGPFSDALVRLGNNGASTETQIVDIATRIGSMGSIVGMTVPQVLAWSSAIASTGQNAEAAGTAISNTMSDIEKAVVAGGDALQGFADVANMSAEDFASTWESSPSDALKAFIDGLNMVEQDGGSATATLSDLGITATRQVQAIEGLMQTVGGLGDALTMSEDAWNGVSDKWGEAGDAAREAAAKADGFSGSVARLQNMAQNLGAEFGESLTPVINWAADVLGDLFESFSEISDSAKLAVVGVGAFAAALGPMILLGKGVTEFFKGLASGLQGVYTAAKAASSVKSLSGAFSLAGAAASDLAGVLKGGLVAGGIALAIGGVAALVSAFQEEQRETELTERATTGLSEACSVAREGMTGAAESTRTYSEQLGDARTATDEMKQGLADLADSFDEINRNASIDLDGLRNAESAVSDFDGRTDLTAQQVGEFKSAIEQLNSQCGTNYEVVRDANGAYTVMKDGVAAAKDEIYALIDAQREQVVAEAQSKKLADYYEQQYENLDKYNQTSEDYAKALNDQADAAQRYKDKYGVDIVEGLNSGVAIDSQEARDWSSASSQVGNLNVQLQEQGELVENDQKNIDKLNASIGNLEAVASGAYDGIQKLVMSKLNQTFDGDTDVMLDFADALDKAGFSTKYLSELSDTELVDLANAWKTTGGDIEKAVSMAGLSATENIQSIVDHLRSMGSTELTSFLSSVNMTTEQFATAMERAGVSSETFGSVSTEAFDFMLENCGGDIDRLMFMIQNYNATPIMDKSGNINVTGEEILLYANGQIYTWNGQQLKNQSGMVVISGVGELHDANGEVYTWNSNGQLQDKNGNVNINVTELYDANNEMYEFDGINLTKNGAVYVDQLQLTDAYDNMVKLEGEQLVNGGIDGTVRVDYSQVKDAQSAVDNLMTNTSATKTINVKTVYSTVGSPSSYSGSAGQAPKSVSRVSSISTPSSETMAVAAKVSSLRSGVSLMSADAASAARAVSAAPKYAAEIAESLSRGRLESGTSTVKVNGAGGVGTVNNYYLGDTKVTSMTDREFAIEFVNLMDRYGRLSKT